MAPPVLSSAELLALSETDVTVRLTPEQFIPALGHAPFVHVEGTFNTRDLGGLPHDGTAAVSKVRPGFAYRSGMINHLTAKGKATLADTLGVRRIFDLRSKSEHAEGADPSPSDAVTLVWEDATEEDPNVSLEPFVEGYGEAGFVDMYLTVLRLHQPMIRAILTHIRDRPQQPFLFHCTAGRDRTGVTAGLLHTLAGESPDVIALDYMMSRIGLEPVREQLEAFARMGAGVPTAKGVTKDASGDGHGDSNGHTNGAATKAAHAAAAGPPPGFLNLISLRVCCWDAFQTALKKEYGPGGYVSYVKSLGFSDSDVATIRTNLTTAPKV